MQAVNFSLGLQKGNQKHTLFLIFSLPFFNQSPLSVPSRIDQAQS